MSIKKIPNSDLQLVSEQWSIFWVSFLFCLTFIILLKVFWPVSAKFPIFPFLLDTQTNWIFRKLFFMNLWVSYLFIFVYHLHFVNISSFLLITFLTEIFCTLLEQVDLDKNFYFFTFTFSSLLTSVAIILYDSFEHSPQCSLLHFS